MPTLYVICAGGEFHPYPGWINEAWHVLQEDPQYKDWVLKTLDHADASYKFNALDAFAVIARDVGPVLLVGKLSTACVSPLQEKLAERAVVQWCPGADDSTSVYEAMLDLIRRHGIGEPEISRRLAVAVLLIAKLERMHYWGGNAKGFMSIQNLAKGNGLDEAYKAQAAEVAQYLSSESREIRLLSSKLGDGYPKYACNNERRSNVYDFLRRWRVGDEQVMKWLTRDTARVSVRELDAVRATKYEESR